MSPMEAAGVRKEAFGQLDRRGVDPLSAELMASKVVDLLDCILLAGYGYAWGISEDGTHLEVNLISYQNRVPRMVGLRRYSLELS